MQPRGRPPWRRRRARAQGRDAYASRARYRGYGTAFAYLAADAIIAALSVQRSIGASAAAARDPRNRKGECVGVALACEPVDRGTARIAEPEQARTLVERLARRVVERRAEHVPVIVLLHVEQLRVPPAREQAEKGRLERLGPEE